MNHLKGIIDRGKLYDYLAVAIGIAAAFTVGILVGVYTKNNKHETKKLDAFDYNKLNNEWISKHLEEIKAINMEEMIKYINILAIAFYLNLFYT